MKLTPMRKLRPIATAFFLAAMLCSAWATTAFAQQKLSLADILIALRSKKATLAERNLILAEAVKQRGVTFTLSADIEKELAATGADAGLMDAIKSQIAANAKTFVATPAPQPTPDAEFYRKRADASLSKGDFTGAISDYDKAVELKADYSIAFLNRGKARYSLREFDKAMEDFNKTIAIDPNSAAAYYNRGSSLETAGKLDEAAADYKKALSLDGSSELVKTALTRVEDELGRLAAAKKATETPPVPEPVKQPEPEAVPTSINMGTLALADAVRLVTPTYSPIAQRANIEGKVTVEIELDEKGNVVEAKAVSGPSLLRQAAEEAAKRSRFKPAMYKDIPVRGFASVIYNFTLRPGRN